MCKFLKWLHPADLAVNYHLHRALVDFMPSAYGSIKIRKSRRRKPGLANSFQSYFDPNQKLGYFNLWWYLWKLAEDIS